MYSAQIQANSSQRRCNDIMHERTFDHSLYVNYCTTYTSFIPDDSLNMSVVVISLDDVRVGLSDFTFTDGAFTSFACCPPMLDNHTLPNPRSDPGFLHHPHGLRRTTSAFPACIYYTPSRERFHSEWSTDIFGMNESRNSQRQTTKHLHFKYLYRSTVKWQYRQIHSRWILMRARKH